MAVQQQATTPFRYGSKLNRVTLPTVSLSSWGQTAQRIELEPVGFLHKLWLRLSGTITTGAGTASGAWATYPELPWSLLSKIRLFVTPNVDLINCSGQTLAKLLRLSRRNTILSGDWAAQGNAGNIADNFTTNTGNAAANTAYTFNACFELPVSTDDSLLWGLVPLQNDLVKANLELTLCSEATVGAITGVTLTPSFTAEVIQEHFVLPQNANVEPPNLSVAHKIIETLQSIPNVGDNRYKPLIGPTYMRHFLQLENDGAALGAGAGNTAIGNTYYRFAGTVYLVNETYTSHVQRAKSYLGETLPDGSIYYDQSDGLGIEGIVDTRDFINTSQQTNVEIGMNINPITLTSAQIRAVDEYLIRAA